MAALLVRSCSSSDQSRGGGRSRKKNGGPKKAPQRGMGVAQLERELERIERTQRPEQQHHHLLPASFDLHQPSSPPAMHALGLSRHLMIKPSAAGAAGFIGLHPMWAAANHQEQQLHSLQDSSTSHLAAILMEHKQLMATPEAVYKMQQQHGISSSSCCTHDFGMRANADMVLVKQEEFKSSRSTCDARANSLGSAAGIRHFHQQHQHRDCRELSLLGRPPIPKELSSFQTKYTSSSSNSNIVWPTLPKVASVIQKRPCYLQQQQDYSPQQQVLLGSPPRGESSTPSSTTTEEHKGAHYTPRSISTALGKSSSSSCSPLQLLDNSARKRGSPSYAESPAPKRSATDRGDFLSLSLTISQRQDSEAAGDECGSLSSEDSSRKSLSMQETVTSVEECNPRSPSYGSSMDLSPNKCGEEIDLSLKL